ncbi:MAG: protein translocase SEC61 complex subunit gamma [Candidatus Thermoplasmatota archaeon]|nr:protein translocase SEC61 complex subunit gamma [Candidatus Thermoplasmatota archaeon]
MAVIDRARTVQDEFDARLKRIGHGKYGRILRMARKPSREEYIRVLQITFAGAAIIGLTGFAIYVFFTAAGPWLWSNYFAGL